MFEGMAWFGVDPSTCAGVYWAVAPDISPFGLEDEPRIGRENW